MFERFTDRARGVVVQAQEEARLLRHNYIGTEHFLLSLVGEGEGVAGHALRSLGVSRDGAREQVRAIIGEGLAAPIGRIPFTPRAKKVLELSLAEANGLGHNYVGTEHILLGVVREGEGVAVEVLARLGVDKEQARAQVIDLLSGRQAPVPPEPEPEPVSETPAEVPVLDRLGHNLTRAATVNSLGPLVARDAEVRRILTVLATSRRNNPLLVGEPGTGRTSLVHLAVTALASSTQAGRSGASGPSGVPSGLSGRLVYDVELSAPRLRPDAKVDDDLELLLAESRRTSGLLVYLDSVLAPAPGRAGVSPAALLHAALNRGEIQVIGTTTPGEYRRVLDADPRILSPFQVIRVEPPSVEEAEDILVAHRDRLEGHHRVSITDAALTQAARLAAERIPDRALPGSALELLDQAAVLSTIDPQARALARIDAQVQEAGQLKQIALDERKFVTAAAARQREKELLAQREEFPRTDPGELDVIVEIEPHDVVAALESLAGTGVIDLRPTDRPGVPGVSGVSGPIPARHPFGEDDTFDVWSAS
jgi:ATP-dependent Clp protease ATP-binding subunit ClpC